MISIAAVHPRSRGEIRIVSDVSPPGSGSPPLARGNLVREAAPALADGFTPARAGKSMPWGSNTHTGPVHPRSRGEILIQGRGILIRTGSPPLARGNPGRGMVDRVDARFTPARAGKSGCGRGFRAGGGVHPRSRGEISRIAGTARLVVGSPPLARGNRVRI